MTCKFVLKKATSRAGFDPLAWVNTDFFAVISGAAHSFSLIPNPHFLVFEKVEYEKFEIRKNVSFPIHKGLQ